ncbi:MAG: RNA polymerase sigma factor region1.1 domain-containing protein [Nitrospirae bacterium]|nr:RNA polymerase sigma factor region1.1 domain-containing protein [Nitrospirota bacterium]
MKERDVFKTILGRALKQGILTLDEINDAFPVRYFSLDRMEALMDHLDELGVKVVDFEKCFN